MLDRTRKPQVGSNKRSEHNFVPVYRELWYTKDVATGPVTLTTYRFNPIDVIQLVIDD
jgi:hypothetical protein